VVRLARIGLALGLEVVLVGRGPECAALCRADRARDRPRASARSAVSRAARARRHVARGRDRVRPAVRHAALLARVATTPVVGAILRRVSHGRRARAVPSAIRRAPGGGPRLRRLLGDEAGGPGVVPPALRGVRRRVAGARPQSPTRCATGTRRQWPRTARAASRRGAERRGSMNDSPSWTDVHLGITGARPADFARTRRTDAPGARPRCAFHRPSRRCRYWPRRCPPARPLEHHARGVSTWTTIRVSVFSAT